MLEGEVDRATTEAFIETNLEVLMLGKLKL